METENEFTRIGKNGKIILLNPTQIKKQAVKEIESGELTIPQAMEKYEITDRRSIISWMRQYSELEESEYIQAPIPIDVRRKAAYQVEIGVLTIKQAAKQYQVTSATIVSWGKRYSTCDVNKNVHLHKMLTSPELVESPASNEPGLLKLKIAALETMIDIAEKQFNIEIRKKAGTKQ